MAQLEKDIQKAICEYLAYKKHFFWRQNTMPVVKPDGSFRAMPKYSTRGVPDIIVIKDGKFIGLEVKQPKGKLGESQVEFFRRCTLAGGEYYVVTSVDEVIKVGL